MKDGLYTRHEVVCILADLLDNCGYVGMARRHLIRETDGQSREMTIEDYRRTLDCMIEKSWASGCGGCAFYDNEEWEEPCKRCKRNCKDYWRAGEKSD